MTAQTPGGPAPSLYSVGSRAYVLAGFHGEKTGKLPGDSKGEPPWHVFAFFLRVKKEGGPQARLLLRYVRA